MRIISLILSCAFICTTVFSQTVIKTQTNRGKNKNITVKTEFILSVCNNGFKISNYDLTN